MERRDVIAALCRRITNEPVVSNLGPASWDLYNAGDREANLYTTGSMGLVSSIGLGIALAVPNRKAYVLDGDGSLLMNLGSLATIGCEGPKNLVHIVWDNQMWGETGGQPTHTARGTDLAAIARGAGIARVAQVSTLEEFQAALHQALREDGPWCIVARVEEEGLRPFPPNDPEANVHRFRQALAS